MSKRLKETDDGWQWDEGPIFCGEEGRRYAVDYGQAIMFLKDLEDLAQLLKEQEECKRTIAKLKQIQAETE